MSEKHKATLQQANQAISRGDFDGFLSHSTEDTEWTFVGEQTLAGKAAVREWMVNTYRVPPRFRVDQLVAEGDFVVAMGEITLKDDSGNDTHHSYCDVWRFQDGKMAALRAFVVDLDPKEAE